MLIPHLKFIESLVVSKKTLDEIQEILSKYGLDTPEEVIARIVKTIRNHNPDYFDPIDPIPADPLWIRELGVGEMFCYYTNFSMPEPLVSPQRAFLLIDDPLMYRLITSMALAKISDEDIDLIVNGKFNMEYGKEDIEIFLKYFFNVQDWPLRDRQKYVDKEVDPQLKKYYKMALKGDKDYLLWKLGAAPEKDFSEMLRDMMHDSYYNFKEQSKVKPETAQRWASLAIKLTDRIDTLEKEVNSEGGNFLENYEFKIKSNISVTPRSKEKVHISELTSSNDD